MSNLKKLMQRAAAGQAGGAGLDVEDVFSTYLYEGNGDGSAATNVQTINNGIDLSGEGGMVWIKGRSHTTDHIINDTVRGAGNTLQPNLTDANQTGYYDISQFNSDGFGLDAGGNVNANGYDYASWTFRKAPKFFTCLTYSGTGSAQNISHDLGSVPGMIIVKRTDTTADWAVYHSGTGNTHHLSLNQTAAAAQNSNVWNNTTPTSTHFSVNDFFRTGASGGTYVAYLFAHNDGDGGFGPDGDSDIIKCGSYTGNGSTNGPEIDLGFEPQWVVIKASSRTGRWWQWDNMRGLTVDSSAGTPYLRLNTSDAEAGTANYLNPQPTGFKIRTTLSELNASGETYIYMAIRRGTKAPESGTEVFNIDQQNSSAPYFTSSFPVDFALAKNSTGTQYWRAYSRLTQDRELYPNVTDQEGGEANADFDYMDGFYTGSLGSDYFSWMWKRAPGYFDVQAFTLGSASNREVKHNLAAVPEMIWWKERSDTSYWMFWHKDFTSSQYMSLHLSDAIATSTNIWGTSAPTSTGWYMKETAFGGSGNTCISYTFASLPGISKVGSVSHTSGSATNVDCGFTAGARFILLKVTNSSGNWFLYDTTRGIVAGADSRLKLNSSAAQNTSDDIDPLSSGFTIASTVSTGNYIFYAIA